MKPFAWASMAASCVCAWGMIAVVHNNRERDPERFTLRAKDPAQSDVGHFTTFAYRDGKRHTQLPVFDAESPK